ncbi:MAG: trypsin-like peptidase domain-containing protein [Bacteroidales bacterium]
MKNPFTLITVVLTGFVAFFLGLTLRGPLTSPTLEGGAQPPAAPAVSSAAAFQPVATTGTQPAVAAGGPAAIPSSFAAVIPRVNMAVVNIESTSRGRRKLPNWHPPFDPFGGSDRDTPHEPKDPPRRGAGSGFIIDPSGYILTNNHVVEGAERVTVKLADGRSLHAENVGADPDIDVALLKVDSDDPLPAAPLGDSSRLLVGEWVCAIGNPLAYEHSVTVGVVSYLGRKLWDTALDDYIQTDAAINFGNSGGPLVNTRGEVIGINAAISSRASNIGFAIPINQAMAIVPQLKASGKVSRGYIGVRLREVGPDFERSLKLGHLKGALVEDVTEGSPGDRAGLRPYDVIQSAGTQKVESDDQLIRVVSGSKPGTTVRLGLIRDGRPETVAVKLAERPGRPASEDAVPSAQHEAERPGRAAPIGLTVRELDRDTMTRLGIPAKVTGVLVSQVDLLSPAYDAEIDRGSVILEINRTRVASVDDFRRLTSAARPGDALTFYVYAPSLGVRSLHTIQVEGQ